MTVDTGAYTRIARLLARHRDVARRVGAARNLLGTSPDPAAVEDAEALAADLEAVGPTFVKLGQVLATRRDLLPPP